MINEYGSESTGQGRHNVKRYKKQEYEEELWNHVSDGK